MPLILRNPKKFKVLPRANPVINLKPGRTTLPIDVDFVFIFPLLSREAKEKSTVIHGYPSAPGVGIVQFSAVRKSESR